MTRSTRSPCGSGGSPWTSAVAESCWAKRPSSVGWRLAHSHGKCLENLWEERPLVVVHGSSTVHALGKEFVTVGRTTDATTNSTPACKEETLTLTLAGQHAEPHAGHSCVHPSTSSTASWTTTHHAHGSVRVCVIIQNLADHRGGVSWRRRSGCC